MKAVVAVVRAPHFSVRKPFSYQAAVAHSLPPPSTLVGALAFSLAVRSGIGGGSGDSYVEECCRAVLRGLVRATVKPLGPLTRSALSLTRVRALELRSSE
ncbi:MAG: type I-A CRISPR-associated protein Cas5, partial [Thermoprotei archaeon]